MQAEEVKRVFSSVEPPRCALIDGKLSKETVIQCVRRKKVVVDDVELEAFDFSAMAVIGAAKTGASQMS